VSFGAAQLHPLINKSLGPGTGRRALRVAHPVPREHDSPRGTVPLRRCSKHASLSAPGQPRRRSGRGLSVIARVNRAEG
jgi:hypothetical protein